MRVFTGLDRGRQSYGLGGSDDAVWYGGIVAGHSVDSCVGGQGPPSLSLLMSSRYIFRIFRTFFYTRYSHFLILSDISHAFSVMIPAYLFMFLVLLMANSYLSFILSFELDFTIVFFISSIHQERTLEEDSNWWIPKTRPQQDYPQRGIGEL